MDCYSRVPIAAIATTIFAVTVFAAGADELDSLVNESMAHSPIVLAARERVQQALSRHRELLEFFDPNLYLGAGKTERGRGIPGGRGYPALTNNAQAVEGGMEVPLEPGGYLTVGGAERFLTEPGDYNHLYQTLVGIRLRIPLLRDRGFVQWDLERARALAEFNAAVSQLMTVMQTLRHDVELAYIASYESLTAYQVAREAKKRFQALLDEARELARLKVIPEYQVFPAEMELDLRQEMELRARQAYETSLVRLSGLLGSRRAISLRSGADILVQLARDIKSPPEIALADAVARRGIYLEIMNRLAAVRAQLARERDDLRADLSLNMGLSWLGESPDDVLGDGSITADKSFGGEVLLVWRRPLEFRGAHSRISRHRSRIAELKHRLLEVEIRTETELQTGLLAYRESRERLRTLDRAVKAARETVKAEQERFRLGEGRSRNVLDAEKDLTNILERQTHTAAELLRARSNLLFAAGYDLAP
jgi:outer membrane protein TolC